MKTVITLIILLSAAFGLSACSGQKDAVVRPAEVVQPPPPVIVQRRPPPVSPLRRKAVSLLERKNYRQAIELMNGRYHDGLEREYVLAINGQLEVGDDAFSFGDYLSAANAFKSRIFKDKTGQSPLEFRKEHHQ